MDFNEEKFGLDKKQEKEETLRFSERKMHLSTMRKSQIVKLNEDESRAIKGLSTPDEMNGCFLISRGGNDYMCQHRKNECE